MGRPVDDLVGVPVLQNVPRIQDDDPVRDLRDDGQVVRDIERRRPLPLDDGDLKALSTSIWVVTSRAVVGSSRTSRSGLPQSAMAAINLCSWPPDTWWG